MTRHDAHRHHSGAGMPLDAGYTAVRVRQFSVHSEVRAILVTMLPKHCGFSIFSNPKLSEHTFQENRGETNIWIFVAGARSMYKFINCRNRNTFYRLAAHWTWNMTSLIDDILLSTIHRALPQFLQPGIWNKAIPLQAVHQQLLSSRRACGNFQGVFIAFHKEHKHFEKKSDKHGTCLPMSFYGVAFVGKRAL